MKRHKMYAFVEHDFDDNGRWVEFTDAEALRLRAEKAEAERDALAARIAERVKITLMPPFPISED